MVNDLLVGAGNGEQQGVLAERRRRAAARPAGFPRRCRRAADTAGTPARLYGPVKRPSTSPSGVPNGGSSGGAGYATVGPARTSTVSKTRAKPAATRSWSARPCAVVVVGDRRAELEQRARARAVLVALAARRAARWMSHASLRTTAPSASSTRSSSGTSTSTSSKPAAPSAASASSTRSRTPSVEVGVVDLAPQHADAQPRDRAQLEPAARPAPRAGARSARRSR